MRFPTVLVNVAETIRLRLVGRAIFYENAMLITYDALERNSSSFRTWPSQARRKRHSSKCRVTSFRHAFDGRRPRTTFRDVFLYTCVAPVPRKNQQTKSNGKNNDRCRNATTILGRGACKSRPHTLRVHHSTPINYWSALLPVREILPVSLFFVYSITIAWRITFVKRFIVVCFRDVRVETRDEIRLKHVGWSLKVAKTFVNYVVAQREDLLLLLRLIGPLSEPLLIAITKPHRFCLSYASSKVEFSFIYSTSWATTSTR